MKRNKVSHRDDIWRLKLLAEGFRTSDRTYSKLDTSEKTVLNMAGKILATVGSLLTLYFSSVSSEKERVDLAKKLNRILNYIMEILEEG